MRTTPSQSASKLSVKQDRPSGGTRLNGAVIAGLVMVVIVALSMLACSEKNPPQPPANVPLSSGPALESTAMPMPGQANDHSVLMPKPAQAPASR